MLGLVLFAFSSLSLTMLMSARMLYSKAILSTESSYGSSISPKDAVDVLKRMLSTGFSSLNVSNLLMFSMPVKVNDFPIRALMLSSGLGSIYHGRIRMRLLLS